MQWRCKARLLAVLFLPHIGAMSISSMPSRARDRGVRPPMGLKVERRRHAGALMTDPYTAWGAWRPESGLGPICS